MFRVHYQTSISSTCELLGISRQVYYRPIASKGKRQAVAGQVIDLVRRVRIEQPRTETIKFIIY